MNILNFFVDKNKQLFRKLLVPKRATYTVDKKQVLLVLIFFRFFFFLRLRPVYKNVFKS